MVSNVTFFFLVHLRLRLLLGKSWETLREALLLQHSKEMILQIGLIFSFCVNFSTLESIPAPLCHGTLCKPLV